MYDIILTAEPHGDDSKVVLAEEKDRSREMKLLYSNILWHISLLN